MEKKNILSGGGGEHEREGFLMDREVCNLSWVAPPLATWQAALSHVWFGVMDSLMPVWNVNTWPFGKLKHSVL